MPKPVGDSSSLPSKTYTQMRAENATEYQRQKSLSKWAPLKGHWLPLEDEGQFNRIHKFAMSSIAIQSPPIDFTTAGDVGNLEDTPPNPARMLVVGAVKAAEFQGVDPLDRDVYEATCFVVALLMADIQRQLNASGITPTQAAAQIAIWQEQSQVA